MLIVLALYYVLPRRVQNIWLLGTSYVFYSIWDVKYALVLGLVTLVNYCLALKIDSPSSRKKMWLWLGIVFDAGCLSMIRLGASGYAERLFASIARWTSAQVSLDMEILLPIGFSFYILQAISYLIDVWRKQLAATKNLIDFGLYMAYFPKLISGPIERGRDFLPKLASPRVVDNLMVRRGFTLVLIGLVRKILLAETLLKIIPDNLFTAASEYAAMALAFYLVLFAFWLYNDFAGYTNIVQGISCLFGIELSPNFRQPYFAHNFIDFWNRWHISLSHWLRDYIYIPISRKLLRRTRKQGNLVNIFAPPMMTMMISGLWHNFGAYMLAWGFLHGLYQALERLVVVYLPHRADQARRSRWGDGARVLMVFILSCLAWVAFGSGSLSRALVFWQAMVTSAVPFSVSTTKMIGASLIILVCLVLDWLQYRADDDTVFMQWSRPAQVAIMAATMLAFFIYFLLAEAALTPFIYQGF